MKNTRPLVFSEATLRQTIALNAESVSLPTIARVFDIKEKDLPPLREAVEALVTEGFAISDRNGHYRAAAPMSDLVVARVSRSLTDRKQRVALKIEGVGEDFPFPVTMHTKLLKRRFGKATLEPSEKIAVVLARHHGSELIVTQVIDKFRLNKAPTIVGHFVAKSGAGKFSAYTPGITTPFNVYGKVPNDADPRKSYIARIPAKLDPFEPALEIAEQKWDPDTGIPIASIIGNKHGIKPFHPKPAIIEAKQMARMPTPFKYRRDLTDEPILVIDPMDARDHDDGILIERTRDGLYRTLVAISDVPYYVRPGSELDKSARQRGFTHYFPDDTFHMLPGALVHHASLREGRSKPVIYVEQFWDEDFNKFGPAEVGAGVIAAQRRMTYGQFEDLVIARSRNISSYLELGDPLVEQMRFEKVTFDIDDKDYRTSYSQMLVAALMIEANTAIPEHLIHHNIPFLSRSHTGSDNLYAFAELKSKLEDWGYDVPDHIGGMTNEALRRIIAQSELHNDKRRVENAIRADFLNQAVYSTTPFGHFGLNRENYAHGTSPIRRYADILTLRGVHSASGDPALGLSEDDIARMPETAKLLNMQQDITRRVNHDVQKYYAVRQLQRLESHWVRATLNKIDAYGAEIALDKQHGLRKALNLNALPDGWAVGRNAKSLVYKDNLVIAPGGALRVKLANIRPHFGDWDFDGMEPAGGKPRMIPALLGPALR